MNRCWNCEGAGRIHECWDEKTCPMAADGGCEDCSLRCPECKGSGSVEDEDSTT